MFSQLRRAGVLALNARNADFISMENRRQLYPAVDNKLMTKALAIKHGVPTPELYGTLSAPHDIRSLPALVEARQSFVIKPAHGSGGDGIVVIDSHRKNRYRSCSGRIYDWGELSHHLANMINGQFSLGGHPDQAMIEYRVRFDPIFDAVSYQGVPDIRIIVYRGYPVMSMVRLPTRISDGKANLHQGAVGAGICLGTGRTINGVLGNEHVEEHPDTGMPVTGIEIPYWDQMLDMAARCFDLTGLGYLGVDLVLDARLGPLMLELNARPGLNVQIANGQGLLPRLRAIQQLPATPATVGRRVALARERFAHQPD
ncbi:MAG: alpha-L-glutamate ligase-like protein [Gammaproteobacteria bacterium]|jgi:alpha-L-glutamate ligase-like protein